jgi:hypothetical protein
VDWAPAVILFHQLAGNILQLPNPDATRGEELEEDAS